MSDHWQSGEDRILELLADEATLGLSFSEQKELQGLLEARPGFDKDCMQRVAATVFLGSFAGQPEALPVALERKIRANAAKSFCMSTDRRPDHEQSRKNARTR